MVSRMGNHIQNQQAKPCEVRILLESKDRRKKVLFIDFKEKTMYVAHVLEVLKFEDEYFDPLAMKLNKMYIKASIPISIGNTEELNAMLKDYRIVDGEIFYEVWNRKL